MAKKILLHTVFILLSLTCMAQFSDEYTALAARGDSLLHAKKFKASGEEFSKAFVLYGGRGIWTDHYNAACAWALAGYKDSAFVQLTQLVSRKFGDLLHLVEDKDLITLHTDARWKKICADVQANKDKCHEGMNKELIAILDTVYQNDQKYRWELEAVEKKYGRSSNEVAELWRTIKWYDSVNQTKVVAILDKHGWLGPDEIGSRANNTIFLVIQHADITTQDKYLPMMREAVKSNKAYPSSLALLEDRVALRHGRKQIYGSQVEGDSVAPIEDPDHVDKRRAQVGLEPLAQYLKYFGITWNLEEYKKQHPDTNK